MRPAFLLPACFLFLCHVEAQQKSAPDVGTLHASTQIVVVDVVVTDSSGKPVHALKKEDFVVTEDKLPQSVAHFDEHSNLNPPPEGMKLPPMPPGTYTDYTPVPPSGALNILLLDALNTPMKDQMYVRYQLQQYVKKAKPGTRIAIFGLAQRLYILQGFTQDASVLKDAVEHKLISRASPLLDDPVSGAPVESMSDQMADMGITASSNLAQFEAEAGSFQTQLRIQYTIDAFNTLANYLAAFPGRKNLIWFSGSFPIDILPDPTLDDSFSVEQENDPEFREMTNKLAQAQVAVYPVDARGLMTNPAFSASQSGHQFARNPTAMTKAVGDFAQSQAEEHMTMEQLADDTGGKAFYNNNDLASAVSRAIELGSNYYTLDYIPVSKKWNGDYRSIKVTLSPQYAAAGFHLSYRRGYFSPEPVNPKKPAAKANSGVTTVGAMDALSTGVNYSRAVMARGAPMPEDLLFKVRVLPASTATEDALAPNNTVDPQHPIKPPFRRYDVDFAALTDRVQAALQADGKRKGALEFIALLYDPDGKLLNATSAGMEFDLSPENYKKFLHGMAAHLEISAPAKGESFLRLGMHDRTSNRFGVVEVPISSVSRLAPPTPPAAPPATAVPAPTPAPPSK